MQGVRRVPITMNAHDSQLRSQDIRSPLNQADTELLGQPSAYRRRHIHIQSSGLKYLNFDLNHLVLLFLNAAKFIQSLEFVLTHLSGPFREGSTECPVDLLKVTGSSALACCFLGWYSLINMHLLPGDFQYHEYSTDQKSRRILERCLSLPHYEYKCLKKK